MRGPRCAAGTGRAGLGQVWVGDFGQPGAQQMVVGVGEEQGVVQPGVGDLVAAGVGNAWMSPCARRRRRS